MGQNGDIAARALATYLIPGCVGRGVRLGSESSSGGAGAGAGGGVWAQARAQAWAQARAPARAQARAQARFLEFWKSGNLEIWEFGIPKKSKNKILKIKICSAQNVGKVWISKKKNLPAPFGFISGNFLCGPEKCKKCKNVAYFPWWANGTYSPGLVDVVH